MVAGGGAPDAERPILLGHDLNGHQTQAVLHALEAAGCAAQVVVVATYLPSAVDADDAATLAAYAVRQWGTSGAEG